MNLKKIIFYNIFILSFALWFLLILLWHKISLKYLSLSIEAFSRIPEVSKLVLSVGSFSKAIILITILLFHIILCNFSKIKNSEKILIAVFSIMLSLIAFVMSYRLLMQPIIQYNSEIKALIS
ncbi:MAG: hypothetical protein ACD_79C00657G0002 [uncultured bacterium]|nr:MAG: hypothetical protein ACD_79C00657G0002 [uncultured bacterium]